MNKKNRIAFRVSDKEFEVINSNAESYGLATGTYLRLLGLSGQSPVTKQAQGRIVMDARGYEGLELRQKDHDVKKPNPQRKHLA